MLLAGIKKVAIDALEEIKNAASGLEVDYKNMDAAEKVRIIQAMGFTPTGDDHDSGCAKLVNRGYICNCVPPATWWMQPSDVDVLRHETYEERRAKADRRSRE